MMLMQSLELGGWEFGWLGIWTSLVYGGKRDKRNDDIDKMGKDDSQS